MARVIATSRRGRGARRKTGVLKMLLKNSIANNWSRFVEHCCRVPGISKEQIKRNRTRPTSMKHSGFRKGNDPRCIYTIEARFSPHRTAILQPYGNGDCNASVFHALFFAGESWYVELGGNISNTWPGEGAGEGWWIWCNRNRLMTIQ